MWKPKRQSVPRHGGMACPGGVGFQRAVVMSPQSKAKWGWAWWRHRISVAVTDLFGQRRPAVRSDRATRPASDAARAADDDFMPLPW